MGDSRIVMVYVFAALLLFGMEMENAQYSYANCITAVFSFILMCCSDFVVNFVLKSYAKAI